MIIVPPTSSQASPAAQELGQKITTVIREYQQSHPGLPSADVRQALRIARLNSGTDANLRFIVVITIGLLVLGGFLALFLSSRSDGDGSSFPIMHVLVAVVVLVMLGVMVAAKR